MITADFLKTNLRELAAKYGKDKLSQAISEHLKFITDNYGQLDPEAKQYADNQFDIVQEMSDQVFKNIKTQPDTVENRQFVRAYLRAKSSHFHTLDLLDKLDAKPNLERALIKDSRDIFCAVTQPILNYLADVQQKTLTFQEMVILVLSYACFEELLTALHLAQHNYAPQSLVHTRVAIEIIDKIELFILTPSEIDVWWNNDSEEVWKQLKPSKVRKKLGKPKEDLVYHLLSIMGVHSNLDYLKSKMRGEMTDKGTMGITINVGGSAVDENLLVMTHGICINTVSGLFAKIIKIFEKHLISEEILKDFQSIMQQDKDYLAKYFYPACEKFGIDTTEMRQRLDETVMP